MFKAANVVHISSGPYHFTFDSTQDLGMITPTWDHRGGSSANTVFLLDLKEGMVDQIQHDLSEIHPSLLMFLRKLRRMDFEFDGRVQQWQRLDETDGTLIMTKDGVTSRYIMTRHGFQVNVEEPTRENVTSSEIVLAFPIDGEGCPIIAKQKTFAFLPLREYGFSVRSTARKFRIFVAYIS